MKVKYFIVLFAVLLSLFTGCDVSGEVDKILDPQSSSSVSSSSSSQNANSSIASSGSSSSFSVIVKDSYGLADWNEICPQPWQNDTVTSTNIVGVAVQDVCTYNGSTRVIRTKQYRSSGNLYQDERKVAFFTDGTNPDSLTSMKVRFLEYDDNINPNLIYESLSTNYYNDIAKQSGNN